MKIHYSYSTIQLEKAVEFISKYNTHFTGQTLTIRESILGTIRDMVEVFPDLHTVGTMGYTIMAEVVECESIDYENNIVSFEILVDPSICCDGKWDEDDIVAHVAEIIEDESESIQ